MDKSKINNTAKQRRWEKSDSFLTFPQSVIPYILIGMW